MIVKTDAYTREQIGKVVQMRANVEGIKLYPDVLDKLAGEGEKSSLRYVPFSPLVIMCRYLLGDFENSYALQLLTPASILAGLSGRKQIEEEDVSEMNELFLDAKTSAAMIENGSFGAGDS
jgi:RuvB-like protein 1 (pontin 52)